MSACPNWRELLATRFDRSFGSADPEGLDLALAHFDTCPACRREACGIDPTLVFRRLPAVVLDFDAEAERMRLAVAGMRASERVLTRRATAQGRPYGNRWRGRAARWAAAAGLAAASLLLGSRGDLAAPGSGRSPLSAERPAFSAVVGDASLARLEPAPTAVESAVEDLGHSDARVYQFDGERLSVVMIFDEKLDV